jgi:hypothetical protein
LMKAMCNSKCATFNEFFQWYYPSREL